MLIPYRVKNPPKAFPYATLTIIVINVIVFLLTIGDDLGIRTEVLKEYGCRFGESPFYTVFTAMFLHADLMHIIGNMLFLWVFGPPVEGRLGIPKYLTLYFLTGFVGDILQTIIMSASGQPNLPGIGASGCIMGVIGAYWYLFSWSTVCVAYFFWIYFYVRFGVWEVAAIWIIALYFGLDVLHGYIGVASGMAGGVANFCHIGGVITGVLLCMIARIKRDTQWMSEAKALQSDMGGDISMLPLHALESMDEEEPGNPQVIRAMINPALNMGRVHVVHEAMRRAGPDLIDKDPGLVGHFLTAMEGDHAIYHPVHLLRLCAALERIGLHQQALGIYQTIVNAYPNQPDAETSLYRMALCCWNVYQDRQKAERCLAELNRRFPNGHMTQFARMLQRQMGGAQ